ncbi:MAG TPA: hypothetical protein VND64_16265 [Pirellulales bacterium]|nr:hypothetical protein [Pirellulales bacterium]
MDDRRACRVHFRHDSGERWASLGFSLRDDVDEGRFLVYSAHFLCEIDRLDEIATSYCLENWESGVISGATFAFRRLKQPLKRLLISELRGRLQSQDMDVLALAAMIGVSALFGGDAPRDGLPGWTHDVEMRTNDAIRSPEPAAHFLA